MPDTSTAQSNSTTVQSSASGAKPAPVADSSFDRGQLLKKILIQQSFGLLCLRVVLGTTMIAYGVPKFLGGEQYLSQIGGAMQHLGVHFGYQFFGMLAALVEVVGGFMLVIGAYFRISCFCLAVEMLIASLSQNGTLPANHTPTDFIMAVLHPLSMAGIFMSALFLGPGRLSIQKE